MRGNLAYSTVGLTAGGDQAGRSLHSPVRSSAPGQVFMPSDKDDLSQSGPLLLLRPELVESDLGHQLPRLHVGHVVGRPQHGATEQDLTP